MMDWRESIGSHVARCSKDAIAQGWIVITLILLSGCEGQSDRIVVRGNVSFDGKPVQMGTIRFAPIEGTKGSVTIAPVEQGKYVADNHGGVPFGRHRVEISAFDLTGFVPGPGKQPKQMIPTKYNDESTLTVDVTETSGQGEVDFQLTP